jgi:hypothetical protein
MGNPVEGRDGNVRRRRSNAQSRCRWLINKTLRPVAGATGGAISSSRRFGFCQSAGAESRSALDEHSLCRLFQSNACREYSASRSSGRARETACSDSSFPIGRLILIAPTISALRVRIGTAIPRTFRSTCCSSSA